jgi:uncharacterized membrane protein
MSLAKKLALALVVAWFLIGGLGHFVAPAFFAAIVPPWVPWPLAVVYVSGVFELLGAIGVLISKYRHKAGIGLFLLTLAVTPANVHMWLNPDKFADISESFLSFRLVFQVFLLWCIWWSTKKTAEDIESR